MKQKPKLGFNSAKPMSRSSLVRRLLRNEFVIRIQPGESIYFKINTKKPGFSNEIIMSELDLSYSQTIYRNVHPRCLRVHIAGYN